MSLVKTKIALTKITQNIFFRETQELIVQPLLTFSAIYLDSALTFCNNSIDSWYKLALIIPWTCRQTFGTIPCFAFGAQLTLPPSYFFLILAPNLT